MNNLSMKVVDMVENESMRLPRWSADEADPRLDRALFEANWRSRQRLHDRQWEKVLSVLPGRIGVRASNGGNARRFVEAILWMAHTRAYWSDVPPEYGAWHAIYIRFGRWAHEGVWLDVIDALGELPETQTVLASMVEKYLTSYRMQRMRGRLR